LNLVRIIRSFVRFIANIGRTKTGKIGLAMTLSFFFIALFGPWLTPYSPSATSGQAYASPSWQHLLGTDDIGEDLLSQLIDATRGSVLVGICSGAISCFVGVTIGLIAGYYGGRKGEALMRFTDVTLALPLLPLLVVLGAVFTPSISLVIALIGLLSWPSTTRAIQSQTISLSKRPFVDASRLSGMNSLEIMFKVLLPNQISLVMAWGLFACVTSVILETALDFIGLGSIQNLSWGIMLYFAFGRNALLRGEWWWFIPPGLMIALFGVGLILIAYEIERVMKVRV